MTSKTIISAFLLIIAAMLVLGCTSPSQQPATTAQATATQTATATPTAAPVQQGSSMSNPATIGASVQSANAGWGNKTDPQGAWAVTWTVEQIVRGDDAAALIHKDSPYESTTLQDTAKEIMLIKVKCELTSCSGYDSTSSGQHVDTQSFGSSWFNIVSDKKTTGNLYATPPTPVFSDNMYSGATLEGWVEVAVYKDDAHPYIEIKDPVDEKAPAVWYQV